jgi:hypothetical protein
MVNPRLRKLSSIRNALVHGDLNISISKGDLAYLLKEIETINAFLKHDWFKLNQSCFKLFTRATDSRFRMVQPETIRR